MKKNIPPTKVSSISEIPANWNAIEWDLKRKLTEQEMSDIVRSYNELKNGAWDLNVIKWDVVG